MEEIVLWNHDKQTTVWKPSLSSSVSGAETRDQPQMCTIVESAPSYYGGEKNMEYVFEKVRRWEFCQNEWRRLIRCTDRNRPEHAEHNYEVVACKKLIEGFRSRIWFDRGTVRDLISSETTLRTDMNWEKSPLGRLFPSETVGNRRRHRRGAGGQDKKQYWTTPISHVSSQVTRHLLNHFTVAQLRDSAHRFTNKNIF